MSFFLFVDESGQDRREAPYMVLAGVVVEDQSIWKLIQSIRAAEEKFFGMRITRGELELKAKKLLKNKTFKHAAQMPPIEPKSRRELARSCLEKGFNSRGKKENSVTRAELTALAQAKIEFVGYIFDVCKKINVKAIASIVDRDAAVPEGNHFLRKDYSYLFERFYYFLQGAHSSEMGHVVFDEIDKTQCYLLLDQMEAYFLRSNNGKTRSKRINPEPFFVHSDMSTIVQVADIIAYVISWGWRLPVMTRPNRRELEPLAAKVGALQFNAIRQFDGKDRIVYGFAKIDDLRSKR
jgi:hypothetical protein